MEVTYTHHEKHVVLALSGMADPQGKPILLCSCKDNYVRLYDLPSFAKRGALFAKQQVHTITVVFGGLFFTGDATGTLSIWKWMDDEPA